MILGGYDHPSTAKLWSVLTHKILSRNFEIPSLPESVPEHEFWPLYFHDENLRVYENNIIDDKELFFIARLKENIDERI